MEQEVKRAETQFDIHPLLAERWSPRSFSDKEVSSDKLAQLFEAARWAPSSSNVQPWRFFVARKGEEHFEDFLKGLMEGNQVWAKYAPVICVNVVRRQFEHREGENHYARHDLGLAMGNLSVQATALGLHLHQMAGIKKQYLQELLDLKEEDYAVVSAFVVGYLDLSRSDELPEKHAKGEEQPRQRKALRDILFGAKMSDAPKWLNDSP